MPELLALHPLTWQVKVNSLMLDPVSGTRANRQGHPPVFNAQEFDALQACYKAGWTPEQFAEVMMAIDKGEATLPTVCRIGFCKALADGADGLCTPCRQLQTFLNGDAPARGE